MSREKHLEILRQLGIEETEDSTPIDITSMPQDIQLIFSIYHMLPSRWDMDSGYYLGKDLNIIKYLFELNNIDDCLYSLNMVLFIDSIHVKIHNEKQRIKLKNASRKKGA